MAGTSLLNKDYVNLTMPVLVAFGTDDKITSYDAGRRLVEKISHDKKEFKSYNGLYHERRL